MEDNMSKTKKVIKSGYNGKMYYSVFQHKKNQQFIVIWEFLEEKDNYSFRANVYPYVESFNRAKTIGYKVNPELFIKANISQWVKLHFSKLDYNERMALREQLYKEEFIEKK
jgi:hypothetical protein